MSATSKIIDLSKVRESRDMNGETDPTEVLIREDNRTENRIQEGERLFVQITQAADMSLVGKTIS